MEIVTPEVDSPEKDGQESIFVEFEPSPTSVTVIEKNGVELIRPVRGAPKTCSIDTILESVGGSIEPQDDYKQQSTYGDNSRLARKLNVSLRTVIEWRKKYQVIDAAMREEAERDLDWVENIARTQMMCGDSKITVKFLEAKGRSRGWGHECVRYQLPEVSNESMNKKLKELSPRDRLKLLAESHKSGEYEGANGTHGGEFK